MQRFFHFGCWNNMKNGNAVSDVMTIMKRKIQDTSRPVDFISVAGDNYYPKKGTNKEGGKKKIIDPKDLDAGFRELPNEPDIYMILGNHDLETNNDKDQPTLFINDKSESDCNILTLQQDSIQNIANIHFELFKEILMTDETLVLMMDTSMYEDAANKYLDCYNIFLDKSFTIKDLREYQERKILASIRKYASGLKNLIMVGHHPITGVKVKKNKIIMLNDIPFFKPVLKNIYDLVPNADFYYLCADLHLYQKGEVAVDMGDAVMNIEQHIVGTGGTKLDDAIPRSEIGKVKAKNDVSYVMLNGITSNGFLECELEDGEPVFRFHKASASELARKTKRNETRRRKQTRGRERKKRRTRRPSLRSRYSLNTLTRRRKSRNSRNTKTRSTRRFVTV